MPRRRIRVIGAPEAALRVALRELRAGLGVPGEFPAAALPSHEQYEPHEPLDQYDDATHIPFFTLDPPAATDLDQALHLQRRPGGGFRVRYAIADVAAFVVPGGALDTEAHRRVLTLYFPDGKIPLYPPALSEGAASLLPDQVRPAVLWTLDLDIHGRTTGTPDVRRALVRSRAKLDYAHTLRHIDDGTAEEPVALLRKIGEARERLETERGGISLRVPEQEIVVRDHTYELVYRAPLPTEAWNAQISLLTGMAAAELMLASGTGVLRTLPPAPDGSVGRLRRTADALRINWPHHVSYARLIRSLDPHWPYHAAFLEECTTLLRGAGYTVFRDGVLPEITTHAAVAAPYTHCTAPLRRLVDRYTAELCLAACAGRPPPAWVTAALDALPGRMAEGARRAAAVERESVDLVDAALLQDRVGDVFDGLVVDVREEQPTVGTVQLESPAVVARVVGGAGRLPLGERLRVRLTQADPGTAKVRFVPA